MCQKWKGLSRMMSGTEWDIPPRADVLTSHAGSEHKKSGDTSLFLDVFLHIVLCFADGTLMSDECSLLTMFTPNNVLWDFDCLEYLLDK